MFILQSERLLRLPMFYNLDMEDVKYITDTICTPKWSRPAGGGRSSARTGEGGSRWGDPRGQVSALDGNRDALGSRGAGRGRGLAGTGVDDIRDPHVEGPELHPEVYRQIWDATNALVTLLKAAS